MKSLRWIVLGLCVFGSLIQACAPDTNANNEILSLEGQVLLEGESDHGEINVRVAFDDGALVGQTLSGPDGAFIFRNVPRSAFRLTFSKEGFDTQTDIVALFSNGGFTINEGQTVTLRPDRSASLSGQLDSSQPVLDWNASATITLQGNGPAVTFAPNGDGRFERVDLRPGTYSLDVQAQGHLPYSTVVTLNTDEAFVLERPIVLVPDTSATLQGQVVLEGAQDNSGVQVRVEVGGALYSTLLTDAQGRFVVRTSRVAHQISFFRQGYQSPGDQPQTLDIAWRNDGALPEGGAFEFDGRSLDEVTFELEPTPTATLLATVSSTRGELTNWPARAFATLISQDNQARRLVPVADAEAGRGQFQFAGLAPGQYTLSVSAQGHRLHSQDVALEVGDNTLDNIELEEQIDGQTVMRGRACKGDCGLDVDHSGIVVRASIGVNPVGLSITDEDGDFAISTSAEDHQLTFAAENFEEASRDVLWSEVQNTFQIGGEPLSDVPIELVQIPTATFSAEISSSQGARDDWPNIAFATLRGEQVERTTAVFNADEGRGQFEFIALPPGQYTLSIIAQGHDIYIEDIALQEGQNTLQDVLGLDVIELFEDIEERSVLSARAALQGQEGDGEDKSGISVAAFVAGNIVATSTTTPDGAFALGVTAQTHRVVLSREGFVSREFTAIWDEAQRLFKVDGVDLEGQLFVLNQSPQSDRDRDGIIDVFDNCVTRSNPNQDNLDGDELGDICDDDIDGDGFANGLDNCPLSPNPMQDDLEGLGLGTRCTLARADKPFFAGCGVHRQRLNTREHRDTLQSRCGGAGAPELVYEVELKEGARWSIDTEARHAVVIYVRDRFGVELDCVVGGSLALDADQLTPGTYQVVIDGFGGAQDAGPIDVSLRSDALCLAPQFPFEDSHLSVGSLPVAVLQGDVNNDGHLDILTANDFGNSVSLLLGDGMGGFATRRDFELEPGVFDLTLGDTNSDGHTDIIALNNLGNNVETLLGDGRGNFTAAEDLQVGFAPVSVTSGDVNNDGHLDILTANTGDIFSGTEVSLLLGDGQGGFGAAQTLTVGIAPNVVALGDVNNDGAQDILTVNTNSANVSVLLGDGQGNFAPQQTFNVGSRPIDMSLGDINGDGDLDVVTLNEDDDTVSVLLGNGQGNFAPQRVFGVGGFASSLALGDLNGDGLTDILTTADDNISVLSGDGLGNFGPPAAYALGQDPSALVLGDVNNDGSLDIITANEDNDSVSISLNAGQLDFAPQRIVTVSNGGEDLLLGDVNNDGHTDVITSNSGDVFFDGHVGVLLNDGRGDFAPQRTFEAGTFPGKLAAGDLNGDGRLDIVNTYSGGITALLGDGQGDFTAQPVNNVQANTLTLADINNDGHLDIITTHTDVQTAIGDGDGGFAPPRTFAVTGAPSALTLLDINNDGHLDIIVATAVQDVFNPDRNQELLTVLQGDGLGTFVPQPAVDTGTVLTALVTGDINQDNHMDLLATGRNSNNVSVWLGDGQGALSAQTPVALGTQPDALLLVDANNDGHLDVLTSNASSRDVSVLVGNGLGDFAARPNVEVGNFTNALAMGDINNDQRLDILTIEGATGNVSVIKGMGYGAQGTLFADSTAPPCPSAVLTHSAQRQAFIANHNAPCRIDRLTFNLLQERPQPTLFSLGSFLENQASFQAQANTSQVHAGQADGLARFEGHPFNGLWQLQSDLPLDNVEMVINAPFDDPLSPDTLAQACNANEDQLVEDGFVCRFGGNTLDGLTVHGQNDPEDVFLLEGDFNGAFILGQTINATLTTAPNADITLELRAFRATAALVTAAETAPGVWALSFVVPARYSGRYFSLHVRSAGDIVTDYALEFNTDP